MLEELVKIKSLFKINLWMWNVVASIFWYDFETTGINPQNDRPLQVAGVRTDLELKEIADPVNFYCQLSDDILPHPEACLVTGITPDLLVNKGIKEADFFNQLNKQMIIPQTCSAGYNTLRFDDEITRYGFYRNFIDPYGREWQGGNSRWDLIDLLRTAYALRPEGIVWPKLDGEVSLKLELLTEANGISHTKAHDALSDVRATISLAKLIKIKHTKLYDYLFKLRLKKELLERITLLKPMLHISGRFSSKRNYLSVISPLAWHPINKNALIVCDLQRDISPLLDLSAKELAVYLYTKHEKLPANILPIPLKLLHINRCPVIAPLSVLRKQDIDRLALDLNFCLNQANLLKQQVSRWQVKLRELYLQENSLTAIDDPEQQLYKGFISERDKKQCAYVNKANPDSLAREKIIFEDDRLSVLLFRYRARNYPATLSSQEQLLWQQFCYKRLSHSVYGAPITFTNFISANQQLLKCCSFEQKQILLKWQDYAQLLAKRYNLGGN